MSMKLVNDQRLTINQKGLAPVMILTLIGVLLFAVIFNQIFFKKPGQIQDSSSLYSQTNPKVNEDQDFEYEEEDEDEVDELVGVDIQ